MESSYQISDLVIDVFVLFFSTEYSVITSIYLKFLRVTFFVSFFLFFVYLVYLLCIL